MPLPRVGKSILRMSGIYYQFFAYGTSTFTAFPPTFTI